MPDQRCGTCRYSSPPLAGDHYGACQYYSLARIPKPYPFWLGRDSFHCGISFDDGTDCPCWKPEKKSEKDLDT